MTKQKRKAIVAFVASHDWCYQLVADHFQITRNQVAGVLFRHCYPVLTAKSPRSNSSNKIGTGYRRGPAASRTVFDIRKGECDMELTRAERRERVKAFHAHIAYRAALLQPLAKAIKPEAMPAETDQPKGLPPVTDFTLIVVPKRFGAKRKAPQLTRRIQLAVLTEFPQFCRDDILSEFRGQNLVMARMIAVYLTKEMTFQSWKEIGRQFGNRDHATVYYSHSKITRLMPGDAELAATVDRIKRLVLGEEPDEL